MKKILLLVVIAVTMLASCDKNKEQTLTIITNADFEPFEYIDENNEIVGFDIDIANIIANDMGMELVIKDVEFDSIYALLQDNQGDMAIAGLSYSAERDKTVDFSNSYFDAKQVVIVKENNNKILFEKDLTDNKLGAQSGTIAAELIEYISPLQYKLYSNSYVAVQDLLNDNLDGVVLDIELAKHYVESIDGIKIVDVGFENERYCIAVKTGNAELIKNINKSLDRIKEDGTYYEIMSKYIK